MSYPEKSEFLQLSKNYHIVPVAITEISDRETPITIFEKLQDRDPVFILESGDGSEKTARYSFIGLDPFMSFKSRKNKIEVQRYDKEEKEEIDGDPFEVFSNIMEKYRAPKLPQLPSFYGGAVGYLGYEMASHLEMLPRSEGDEDNFYDSYLMFCKTLVVYDHRHHTVTIIENVLVNDQDLEAQYQAAIVKTTNIYEEIIAKNPATAKTEPGGFSDPVSNFNKEEFMEKVTEIKESIKSGDIFQAVLSRRVQIATDEDPYELYRILRRVSPSPYMYLLNFPDIQIIGASPEMLVKLVDEEVTTRPIAGTRKRTGSAEEDHKLAQELISDEKERAEHLMLLDLGRNDIGKVSTYGSVHIAEQFEIEYFSHVMHIISEVKGTKRPELSALDVLKAALPAGTVSGAPKIRAMEILNQMEPVERGPYSGAVGYLAFNGNMDTAISIRTMVMKNNNLFLQAGAGIVYDSEPEKEFQETKDKLKGLMTVIDESKKRGGNTIANANR